MKIPEVSPLDLNKIIVLARTAHRVAKAQKFDYSVLEASMDLRCWHAKMPLDLDAMIADYEKADVLHDLFGIRRFLNRETGELGGCFVPRYAKPELDKVEESI